MDELDTRLITLLRHNGRRSISDLAVETGASRATVRASSTAEARISPMRFSDSPARAAISASAWAMRC